MNRYAQNNIWQITQIIYVNCICIISRKKKKDKAKEKKYIKDGLENAQVVYTYSNKSEP